MRKSLEDGSFVYQGLLGPRQDIESEKLVGLIVAWVMWVRVMAWDGWNGVKSSHTVTVPDKE